MATLKLLIPTLSQSSLPQSDKPPTIRTANYAQIPSWISLKSPNSSLLTSNSLPGGDLENVHLVSLCKQAKLSEAHQYLLQMDRCNVPVFPQSYKHFLQACSNSKALNLGKLIHRRLRQNPPGFILSCLLRMYCNCGALLDAQKLFDEMPERTLGSFALIISAYANSGLLSNALEMYIQMQNLNLKPNPSIYTSLLKNCSDLEIGKQLHCQVIKAGYCDEVAMGTCVCNMYVKFGNLQSAEMLFDRMDEKNVVSWMSMMVGFTQKDRCKDALRYFRRMADENFDLDEFVFSITLKACASLNDRKTGEQVHGLIVKLALEKDVSVGTPLVDFYVKCDDVESAARAFDRITEPNDVSWSAILSGYSENGEFEKCTNAFKSLRRRGMALNEFMYTSMFHMCASFADFNFGSQVHADAVKRGLISRLYGESAMISMYAKCGRLDYAHLVFESIDEPDTVAWTAMLSGYAYHGNASDALTLFKKMEAFGVRMNSVTFIAVLATCSHAGLVQEAQRYLQLMSCAYNVEPTIEHYNCMIDAYARAGLFHEALDLIHTMPFKPNALSWKSLLGGCSIYRHYKLGNTVAEKLLELDPDDAGPYILLFNLHASLGKWDEAANIRKAMARRGVQKDLGCSWITIKDKVHRFIVGDRHHPETDEIYSKLEELGFNELGKDGRLMEEDAAGILVERREQMLVHSERLAIAFGLISAMGNAPIVVFKNLRACRDCHDFAKHVSGVTGRTIIVRDGNRFHRFESGACSCNDYW